MRETEREIRMMRRPVGEPPNKIQLITDGSYPEHSRAQDDKNEVENSMPFNHQHTYQLEKLY